MRSLVLVALCGLIATQPAFARSWHHRYGRSHVGRSSQAGMPITAQSDSIRINAVGEVISKPTPVIQKERDFNSRADRELLNKPPKPTP